MGFDHALADFDLAHDDAADGELEVGVYGMQAGGVDGIVAPVAGAGVLLFRRFLLGRLRRQVGVEVELLDVQPALDVGLGAAAIDQQLAGGPDGVDGHAGVHEGDLGAGQSQLALDAGGAEVVPRRRDGVAGPRRQPAHRGDVEIDVALDLENAAGGHRSLVIEGHRFRPDVHLDAGGVAGKQVAGLVDADDQGHLLAPPGGLALGGEGAVEVGQRECHVDLLDFLFFAAARIQIAE